MKQSTLILSLFFICLFNCANDSEDDLIETTPLPNLVTYNDDIKTVIDNNCISCHASTPNSGASISLVTYTNVKSAVQNNNLISKINGNGPGAQMPFGAPKLPQNLIDLIEKWETDGLLEN
ncbi:hypothetical protein [Aestuariibaculum lutulentum]|uniref:Cytochrome c domain-containing protein n=1 Tax=Aestuariibaculum lutulentum TaxID=2920935 RepID=A0ABS9RK30_9FLAO|nr:hypothetical protein [Aestuariibaculum lutulentum]MCH4552469.1 hypothetical protein [Aestuariibaculum lutulentum]